MKKITFWLFALLTCWQLSAQTTVTIGTGTTASATGTNASPVYRSSAISAFNFSQSIELLTATDLTSVGVTSGSTITKIAYKKTNAFTLSAGRSATVNIYLKNSAATALTNATNFVSYISGASQCYTNTNVTATEIPAAAGWVEFVFNTPFNYTGGSIEVAIDWAINPGAGDPTTGGFAWEYTTVTANQAAGTSAGAAITGNLTTVATRLYNTQLTYTNTPCSGIPAPGNTLAPSLICSGASATLSLQNPTVGSGVTYQWYKNAAPISGATSGVYVIPSVTTTDTYYCEVTCSGNTAASSTISVGPTILTAPVFEPFTTFLPNACWSYGDNGDLTAGPATFAANNWFADGLGNVGTTGAARITIDGIVDNDWILSPQFTLPATGYELKFLAAATQAFGTATPTTAWEADDFVEVLVSTTGNTNWTPIYTFNNSNVPSTTGSIIAIDLDTYAGQTIKLAYRAVEGTANGAASIDFSIDNFELRLSPTCPDMTGLTIGGVTSSGANTSWDDLSPAAVGYQYAVTTSMTPPASGTDTTATFYVASGLMPQSVYYLHVRADCGSGSYGNWATSTFTTLCAPITALPTLDNFTTFLPNSCWTEADNGDLLAGPLTFGTSDWVDDGFSNVGATGSLRYEVWLATANDWVISPEYTIPVAGYELKLDAAATQWNNSLVPTNPWEADDFVEILATTTGYNNWTVLHTYNNTNQPGITATSLALDLDAYAGQNVRFAFRVVEGATNGPADINFYIDNFQVRLTPTCPDMTGLTTGSITFNSANTSWDDLSPAAVGYQYAVTTSITPPATGTDTSATFYVAGGLMPQTVYYLHVRADCGSGAYGNWSTTTFTTACAPITALPFLEPFTTFLPNACWSYGDNGDLTAGPATFAANNWFADGLGNVGTTGAARITIDGIVDNDWILSPQFTLPATGYELKFLAAATQAFGTATPTTAWEADDFVEVLVSTTGNTNWTPIYTFNNSNVPSTTGSIIAIDLDTYAGQTIKLAYRAVEGTANGAASIDFSIDNFELRLSPTCPDMTGLTIGGVTSSGANTSWDDLSPAAVGYQYAVTTSMTPPASGTDTTATFYVASGLMPQSVYYLHVRADCGSGSYGNWATSTFTTLCEPITSLPWIENFDSVITPALPQCWLEEVAASGYETSVATIYNTPKSGLNYLREAWSATNEFVWSPAFNLTAGTSYDFSSWIQGDGFTGWTVDYFVNTAQLTTGATQLGSQYIVPGTGTQAIQPYAQVTRTFVPTTSGVYYFALRVNQPSFAPWYVAFDDMELKLSPPCVTPSPSASNVTTTSADISWFPIASATGGYEYVFDTTAGDPVVAGTVTSGTTYAATSLTLSTAYYFHIRSICAAGTYSTWTNFSFTTPAFNPPANDNCSGAIMLTNGGIFATNEVVASNGGATNSNPPAPGCASFAGGDVWYAVTIPASGSLTVETGTGTITDTGMAIYSGTCAGLTLVQCSDDESLNGAYSLISLSGRTPGEVLYVSVWEYSNDLVGDFKISAYDASILSSDSFDASRFVAYPNPVKDVLNLSYSSTISNVKIFNLLGQEVLNTNANTSDVKVNMSALNSGAYLVNITFEDTIKTIKIIKE